jgi:hypothetical protein
MRPTWRFARNREAGRQYVPTPLDVAGSRAEMAVETEVCRAARFVVPQARRRKAIRLLRRVSRRCLEMGGVWDQAMFGRM